MLSIAVGYCFHDTMLRSEKRSIVLAKNLFFEIFNVLHILKVRDWENHIFPTSSPLCTSLCACAFKFGTKKKFINSLGGIKNQTHLAIILTNSFVIRGRKN